MPSIFRFLDDGTAELRRAFARMPDIERLLAGDYPLPEYRRLLERLRRGFAAIELYAFDDLSETQQQAVGRHRSTWRLSHDIGILGGTTPMPSRLEDLENAGALASISAKLGAQFALAGILETLAAAHRPLRRRFGAKTLSCLLFNASRDPGFRRFRAAVDELIEGMGSELDWAEALAGARRALRTVRHGLMEASGASSTSSPTVVDLPS